MLNQPSPVPAYMMVWVTLSCTIQVIAKLGKKSFTMVQVGGEVRKLVVLKRPPDTDAAKTELPVGSLLSTRIVLVLPPILLGPLSSHASAAVRFGEPNKVSI